MTKSFSFWDLTLDSNNLSQAPVWDLVHGFGGNGALSTPEVTHGGHCVLEGPFSNTTRAWSAVSEGAYHDVELSPNCMSRGFTTSVEDLAISTTLHNLVTPEYVEETLQAPDYLTFFERFEQGAHNAIPQYIKGDWLTFTAPNGECSYPCVLLLFLLAC